jgi:hypothetical protein
VLLGAAGYLVLAGVVAVENVVGLAASETPVAMVVLYVIGVFALLAAGLLALRGVTRSFTADGIEHA